LRERVAKKLIAAVGGTFEDLHRGHKALLMQAFEVGDRVVIGLTTNEFAERLKNRRVAPYAERLRGLEKFLEGRGLRARAEIAPLADRYGPAVEDASLDAIIVSEETRVYADEINERRREKGLPLLEVITVAMVLAEDGRPISTTRIKKGEIDIEGRVLGSWKKRNIYTE